MPDPYYLSSVKKWTSTQVMNGLLAIGVLLRLWHYLGNRSLWYDETLLALNFIRLNFTELLGPLEFNQQAPILYLWLQKLLVELFGSSEWVLRFSVLIISIFSLWLFRRLSRLLLSESYQLWAMVFFALCQPLIYFAAEVKPYAFDVFFALSLSLLSIRVYRQGRGLNVLGGLGLLSIFGSMPSVFTLAAAGSLLLLKWGKQKNWKALFGLTAWGGIWLTAFAINYFFFLNPDKAADHVQAFHQAHYLPLAFWKWENIQWYINTYFILYREVGGIFFSQLAGILALVGLIKGFANRRAEQFLLLMPVLTAVFVSAFQLYSTIPRLMLFASPALILFVVKGLEVMAATIKQSQTKILTYVPLIIGGLLLLQPILNNIHRLIDRHERSAFKKSLNYLMAHKQAGDTLYLRFDAQRQFDYYQARYDWDDLTIIHNPVRQKDWQKVLKKGKGRSWVLFSQFDWNRPNYLEFLDKRGHQVLESSNQGSAIYLYDLD